MVGRGRAIGRLSDGALSDEQPVDDVDAQKSIDHLAVELNAGDRGDFLARAGVGLTATVRAVADDRVVGVGHGEDACSQRNVFAKQAARVTAAIDPLVVILHDGERAREHRNFGEQSGAKIGVPSKLEPLVGRQRTGLLDDGFANAEHACVVQEGAKLDLEDFGR